MKCLFCGKELAIFKRLSGSEFCSDAHRKQYQQEYNQLALSRLLHTQPAGARTVAREPTSLVPNAAGAETPAAPSQETGSRTAPAPPLSPEPQSVRASEPPRQASEHSARTQTPHQTIPNPRATEESTRERIPVAPNPAATPSAPIALGPVGDSAPVAESTPPAPPFAGPLEHKPPASLAVTVAHRGAAVELVEVRRRPETPAALVGRWEGHLTNGEQIPMDSGFVTPRTSKIKVEGTPEPRDFERAEPRVETSYSVLIPMLEVLTEPHTIPSAPRTSGPATIWSFPEHGYVSSPRAEAGRVLECDLITTGFDVSGESAEGSRTDGQAVEPKQAVGPQDVAGQHAAPAPRDFEKDSEKQDGKKRDREPSTSPTAELPSTEATQAAERSPQNLAPKLAPIDPRPATAGKAKPVQMFQAEFAFGSSRIEVPKYDPLPLRPVMVVSTAPPRPAAAPAATQAPKATTAPVQAPKPATPPQATTTTRATAPGQATRSTALPQPEKVTKPTDRTPAAKVQPVRAPTVNASPAKMPLVKTPPVKVQTAKTSPAVAESGKARPANGVKTEAAGRPAPPSQPANSKPSPTPPAVTSQPAESPFGQRELQLPQLHVGASRMPNRATLLAASGVGIVLILLLVIFSMKGSDGAHASAAVKGVNSVAVGKGPDWIENFSPDAKNPHTISILRSTSTLQDYTIEMAARIDSKALGWVFRAKDPKNFQVAKIEVRRSGTDLNPFLVHYAVIDGAAETRTDVPVPVKASPSTVFKIRLDVAGNRFTAYVQDRKADEWADTRLPSGGAGTYSENGERAFFQSAFVVTPAGKTK